MTGNSGMTGLLGMTERFRREAYAELQKQEREKRLGYKVVKAATTDELARAVHAARRDGWMLQGGLIHTGEGWAQAMSWEEQKLCG